MSTDQEIVDALNGININLNKIFAAIMGMSNQMQILMENMERDVTVKFEETNGSE